MPADTHLQRSEHMAEHASDYHRGAQDIHEQVNTFHAFGAFTKWSSLILAGSLLMLTLWFCTDAGFLGGLVTGLVVLAIGVFALRERKPKH
jgi:hypothetical protein